jgi:hypothetical protein
LGDRCALEQPALNGFSGDVAPPGHRRLGVDQVVDEGFLLLRRCVRAAVLALQSQAVEVPWSRQGVSICLGEPRHYPAPFGYGELPVSIAPSCLVGQCRTIDVKERHRGKIERHKGVRCALLRCTEGVAGGAWVGSEAGVVFVACYLKAARASRAHA